MSENQTSPPAVVVAEPVAPKRGRGKWVFVVILLLAALAGAGIAALLLNINQRKIEAQSPVFRLVNVTEDTTDPAEWGKNFQRQYDSYQRTVDQTHTQYGGSEALPPQKSKRDPWLTAIFQGYAFAIDYRDRRGHAYMLTDQEATKRIEKPQSGSCLHCHASIMPLYRELGGGDAMKGFNESFKLTYQEANKKLHDMGHGHSVSCVDCHDPKNNELRVTRPGFILGIRALARSDKPVPHLASIERWRGGSRAKDYDPNVDASRQEMRSFVCGQCHVEYYCATKMPLTFPWGKGLKADDIEQFWDETKFPDGHQFFDYKHAETGAEVLKAQHPEFELWSQGVHARSGVACADCHMPYVREGAMKISDHWVRSPLLNINRACQQCHHYPEDELKQRVKVIQDRTHAMMTRAGNVAVEMIGDIKAAKAAGATEEQLRPALLLQRKAQWRLDFIAAENSMGFHAPPEAMRVLGESIDYSRQAQLHVSKLGLPATRPVGK
jgi:nitrite reductase (cytochrome c-552)